MPNWFVTGSKETKREQVNAPAIFGLHASGLYANINILFH